MPVNIQNVGTSTAPFTWACGFNATAAPGSALAQMFGMSDTGGSANAFAFYQASSTSIGYGWNNTAGDVLTVPNIVNTGFHSCCAVAISNTNNLDYYDGSLNTTVTTGSVNSAFTAERYTFNGLAFTTSTGTINGSVFYGAYWTRALTAPEARKLHDDPWCFLIYPEDEIFAEWVGVVASGSLPFNQYDWNKPLLVKQRGRDDSVGLNPNIFTNPFPNNQYDYPKVWDIRQAPFDLSVPLNPNIFTNPFPIFNGDGSSSKINPDWASAPPPPLNINIFTNPIPFVQTDWSKPFRVPRAPWSPDQSLNINLFTNPYPFNQVDWSRPTRLASVPLVDVPYNQNLYTVTVVANPIIPVDWAKPFFPKSLYLPDQALNPNLFTNPYPFLNQFYPTVGIRSLPQPDQALNINLFTNPYPVQNVDVRLSRSPAFPLLDQTYNVNLYGTVAVAALPFNPTDQFRAARPIYSSSPDIPYNQRLFTNPVPFNQFDYPKTKRTAQAPFDLSFSLNLNLFTNPIPFLNVGTPSVLSVRGTPSPDIAYNQNLYTVTVVATPFNAVDWARPFFPKTLPLFDQGLNPNLFTPGAARIDELDVTILSGTIVATISTGTIGETILAGSLVTNVSVGTVATTILSGTLIADITE